ncbi:MAG: hypothetical protein AB7K68_03815 [Bacteriovoracia bacterium]
MKYLFVIAAYFLSFPALAEDHPFLQTYLEQLSRIDEALKVYPQCKDDFEDQRPLCSNFSDQLCSNLWNAKNKGNMPVFDGKIVSGESTVSGKPETVLENHRALLAAKPRLPADFVKQAGDLFEKWGQALAEERKSKEWDKRLLKLQAQYQETFENTVTERVREKYPDLADKKFQDFEIEEQIKYYEIQNHLSEEIIEAKYKNHPNWKRVEGIFSEAKNDVIAAVKEMPLSEKSREEMVAKLEKIELTLPYWKIGASEKCSNAYENATYFPAVNKFTFCAGMFNSMQSASALYGIAAHEIGHSIDPNNRALEDWSKKPATVALAPLTAAEGGRPMNCPDWQKTKAAIFGSETLKDYGQQPRELSDFYGCLKSTKDLDPITANEIRRIAKKRTRRQIDATATRNNFLDLAVVEYEKFGEKKINEKFLRPDLLYAENAWQKKTKVLYPNVDITEIFAQDLACQTLISGGKEIGYLQASEKEKEQLFAAAIEQTEKLYQIQDEEYLSTCGRNCDALSGENLGIAIGEEFADWISFRAFSKRLRRIPTLAQRSEASALFGAFLCEKSSITNAMPGLTKIEKDKSTEEHGEGRIRRTSVYSKENAEILGCRLEPEMKGFGQCEP